MEASAADSLTVIRRRSEALLASMQLDQSYAELQNAVGRVENSIGIDPLPETVSAVDIDTLAREIAEHDRKMG